MLQSITQDERVLHAVEAFLYREAKYMDRHDYDSWLSLWEDELTYWVPCNDNDFDPQRHVSLIYDDRDSLLERVRRLKGKHAFSQRPKSRLVRAISNVELVHCEADELLVESVFILGEVRNSAQSQYFGRCLHTLVRRGDSFGIKSKKVMLINNDSTLGNLTFLL